MAKVKQPLLSFDARRKLGDDIVFARRGGSTIAERHSEPQDAKSPGQLSWRHMFLKVVALWHALSAAEKEAWESLGRKRHMTGYAWFVSQALRPNPGIYLPLQGGVMQGIIDMDGYAIQDLLDPVNPQDADTEAARDAAIAAALEDCIDSHIHGWDGANWQRLLVESATRHRLQVAIYSSNVPVAGINIASATLNPAGKYGLATASIPYLWGSGTVANAIQRAGNLADNDGGGAYGVTGLMGYNGSSWDRLRSWGTGILKIGRAEIGLSTLRRVGAGAVKGSAGALYWVTMNPTAANSVIELTDDLDGSTAVVWDMTHGVNSAHHMNIDPPMEFSTGIWLKTLTNFTSIIFGYK